MSSPETSASSTRVCVSSASAPSPSSPDSSLRRSCSPSSPSSSSDSVVRSSPMSRASSRSWMASPKRAWFSISRSSRSRSRPARSSISGRQSSTIFFAAGGGAWPVSRSRTISATASSIGASARSVTSSNFPRWKRSSSMAERFLRHARHAARADRLDARLLDRLEHRARLLPARHQLAMHHRIMTGELERDRIGMAAHDRGVRPGELARRLGQPCLAADDAGAFGGKGDFELGLAGNRAQAARDRPLERLGRAVLWHGLAFDVDDMRRQVAAVGPALSSAPRSPTIPAAPARSSADRTRRRSAAPARRIC